MKPRPWLQRRSRWRTRGAVVLAASAMIGPAIALLPEDRVVVAQTPEAGARPAVDPASCKDLAPDRLAGVLGAVPKYGSTYVLVVPQRLAATAPSATAPGVKGLHVGVHAGTPAVDVARSAGITKVREYALDAGALLRPLQDAQEGTVDAAILWAPLAGFGIIELGLEGQVSVLTLDRPHPGPASLRAAPGGAPHPCAAAIADELDASGVLPAELLVTLDLREFLGRRPPVFSLADARKGEPLFNQVCASCHGANAVADPHGLAPVDLRITTPRSGFPGFSYIVLNGRPQKSMPPLRGTLTEEQVALIYQYLKARSQELL